MGFLLRQTAKFHQGPLGPVNFPLFCCAAAGAERALHAVTELNQKPDCKRGLIPAQWGGEFKNIWIST